MMFRSRIEAPRHSGLSGQRKTGELGAYMQRRIRVKVWDCLPVARLMAAEHS